MLRPCPGGHPACRSRPTSDLSLSTPFDTKEGDNAPLNFLEVTMTFFKLRDEPYDLG